MLSYNTPSWLLEMWSSSTGTPLIFVIPPMPPPPPLPQPAYQAEMASCNSHLLVWRIQPLHWNTVHICNQCRLVHPCHEVQVFLQYMHHPLATVKAVSNQLHLVVHCVLLSKSREESCEPTLDLFLGDRCQHGRAIAARGRDTPDSSHLCPIARIKKNPYCYYLALHSTLLNTRVGYLCWIQECVT